MQTNKKDPIQWLDHAGNPATNQSVELFNQSYIPAAQVPVAVRKKYPSGRYFAVSHSDYKKPNDVFDTYDFTADSYNALKDRYTKQTLRLQSLIKANPNKASYYPIATPEWEKQTGNKDTFKSVYPWQGNWNRLNTGNTAQEDMDELTPEELNQYERLGPLYDNNIYPGPSRYSSDTSARTPEYSGRKGTITTPFWVELEGRKVPTIQWQNTLFDGPLVINVPQRQYDYKGDWRGLDYAPGKYDYRMPAALSIGVQHAYDTGLIDKDKNGLQITRLSDLFRDQLAIPGNTQRSDNVARLLLKSIGDKRRQALSELEWHSPRNYGMFDPVEWAANRTSNSYVHDLAMPISPGDLPARMLGQSNVKANSDAYMVDNGSVTHSRSFLPDLTFSNISVPLLQTYSQLQNSPQYQYLRNGVVRVGRHDGNSAYYHPYSKFINIPEEAAVQDLSGVLNTNERAGQYMLLNDMPSNQVDNLTRQDTMDTLHHEGSHAMTNYIDAYVNSPRLRDYLLAFKDNASVPDSVKYNISNVVASPLGRTTKWNGQPDVTDIKVSDYDKLNPATLNLYKDILTLAHKGQVSGFMGLGLGTKGDTSTNKRFEKATSGYAQSDLAEALRALHQYKVGLARHLMQTRPDMSDEKLVDTVQDPSYALEMLDRLHLKQRNPDTGKDYFTPLNPEERYNYQIPNSMTPQYNENEFARAVGGLQTLLDSRRGIRNGLGSTGNSQFRIGKQGELNWAQRHGDNPQYEKDSDEWNVETNRWKDNFFTPEQRLEIFKKIWPQVRNEYNRNNGLYA